MKTLVKFDDLAFVLLFFFIMLATVSFAESAESQQTDECSGALSEHVSTSTDIWIYNDGSISAECGLYGDILLHCSDDVCWKTVRDFVFIFTDAGNNVRIAIE